MYMCHDSFLSAMNHSYATRLIHMHHASFMRDMTENGEVSGVMCESPIYACIRIWGGYD